MITLPSPGERYDARNESETRRSIEQALADLASAKPDVSGPSVGGSGTTGKIPIWTGASTLGDSDIDAPNIAYLSDLFTQAMADARYSLLGHTHSASEITDFDAAIMAFGDARYFQLSDTSLPGPLDIGDVTGIAAAMLRVGGDVRASGEMDADDFVLVGGSAGGGASAALFSVLDEGVLKANNVTSINFTGAGVVASAVGGDVTVEIVFDQAAADARYSLLGHTHAAAQVTDFNIVGDARWVKKSGDTMSGGLVASGFAATSGANTEVTNESTGTSGRKWGWLSLTDGSMGFYDITAGYVVRLSIGSTGTVTLPGETTLGGNLLMQNGTGIYMRRSTNNDLVRTLGYDSGTDELSIVLGGPILRWRDTGTGVLMYLDSSEGLAILAKITVDSAGPSGGVSFGTRTRSVYGAEVLNGGGAARIRVGSILVSDAYADDASVPTNGAYIKGNAVAADFILS